MNFLNELRYTLRILMKNYWYTLLCCSVLAVGIGIVLPLYVLVANLTFKTPDFPDGKSYVAVIKNKINVSAYDAFHYRYFQENAASFSELHAWQNLVFTISDGDYNEVVRTAAIEPQLLRVPQTQPLLGRIFSASDIAVGASPVAIISYDLWHSSYAAREDIIGVNSRINGVARTIIGVMPPGFRFPLAQDLWIPLSVPTTANVAEGAEDLLLVGKLQAGVNVKKASDEVSLLETALLASWPDHYRHITSSTVVPYILVIQTLGPGNGALSVIFSCLILLVAFNAGNLFLARGEERLSELSIRGALGASSGRIASTLLLESFLVCCCGLVAGWLVAYFALESIDSYYQSAATGPNNFRMTELFWWDMSLNSDVLALSALAVLSVWIVSGGLPAWRLSRRNLSESLSSGNKGSSDKGATTLSKALVNMQLALGCALLTLGAVQTVGYYSSTPTITAGAEFLYRGTLDFRGGKFITQVQQQQYLERLAQALAGEPNVQQVAFTSALPGAAGPRQSYNLEDQDLKVDDIYPSAWVLTVSSNYLDVLGFNLLEGRDFNAGDTPEALPVVIIDQRMAARYWPSDTAVGKRIQINPLVDANWYTVIGVSTPSIQEAALDIGESGRVVIYRPTSQTITELMRAVVQVDSAQITPAGLFRAVASKVDRDIPISDMITVREQEVREDENARFETAILGTFVIISLYMTGIATYGLAARLAGRRRLETGVRMAVGANQRQALWVFIRDGLKTVVVGLSLGGVFAIGLSYALMQGGSGVETLNWLVTITLFIAIFLATLVILANYFPARKLINMEPADALRDE